MIVKLLHSYLRSVSKTMPYIFSVHILTITIEESKLRIKKSSNGTFTHLAVIPLSQYIPIILFSFHFFLEVINGKNEEYR